jgi:hypothetical protein
MSSESVSHPFFRRKLDASYMCARITNDIAQNVQKRFINFYYTHEGRHEGLYTNNDDYDDATPSSSSIDF